MDPIWSLVVHHGVYLFSCQTLVYFYFLFQMTQSLLTLFVPMFPFDTPENVRKPPVSRGFQGDQKGTLGRKGLNILCRICQIHKCDVLLPKKNMVNSQMLLTNVLVRFHMHHSYLDIFSTFQQ